MKNESRFELRLSTSLLQRLKKVAKEEDRTLSNLVRFILEKFLKAHK